MLLAHLFWDPDRAISSLQIPFLERPLLWYGFFFALGFFLGYLILVYLLRRYFLQFSEWQGKESPHQLADRLTVYMVFGTLIGARLGDLLFYQDWGQIAKDPFSVVKIWEGGLASHGAAVGILMALFLFARRVKIPFLRVLDLVVIPTALGCALIRVGNFFNQEILGTVTDLPWGIIFGHPADGGPLVPRHPAQLYEALFLFAICGVLGSVWRKGYFLRQRGRLAGLFVLGVFTSRFFIEFIKVEQSFHLSYASLLTMGQYLSLPFIVLGAYLLFRRALTCGRFLKNII